MTISLNYLLRRLALAFFIVIGVIVFSYTLILATPGDPAVKWAGRPRGPGAEKAIELARRELGLDKPIYIQVVLFIYNFFTGNLGHSIAYKGQPVFDLVVMRFMSTLELTLLAYIISIPVAFNLGLQSALKRGSNLDNLIQSVSVVLASTPSYWLAILLLLFTLMISTSLGISMPVYGTVSPKLEVETGFELITGSYLLDSLIQGNILIFVDALLRMILPAIAISLYPIGALTRLTRILVAESLLEDYVKASIALGVKREILIKHFVLRSITPSFIQVAGLSFTYSLIDAMIVESIFGRRGLGDLLISALYSADFKIAVTLLALLAVFYVVVNTVVDILQAIIDPRVRL